MTAKSKKIIKTALSALWWTVLVLLAILLVSIISAKAKGNVPSIFGYSVMHIVSGSMETEIPQNSYILIKQVPPEEVEYWDVITFYSDDPAIKGMPNTHRVVAQPTMTEQGIQFTTKGDANPANDIVTAKGDKLIGKYVRTLKGLTRITSIFTGKTTIVLLVVLQIATMGIVVYSIVTKKEESSAKDAPQNKN